MISSVIRKLLRGWVVCLYSGFVLNVLNIMKILQLWNWIQMQNSIRWGISGPSVHSLFAHKNRTMLTSFARKENSSVLAKLPSIGNCSSNMYCTKKLCLARLIKTEKLAAAAKKLTQYIISVYLLIFSFFLLSFCTPIPLFYIWQTLCSRGCGCWL